MSGTCSEIKQDSEHLEGGKSEEIKVKLEVTEDDSVQIKPHPAYAEKDIIKTEPEVILGVPEDFLQIKVEPEDSDSEGLIETEPEVILEVPEDLLQMKVVAEDSETEGEINEEESLNGMQDPLARVFNIPISLEDIVNLPLGELNRRLKEFPELTSSQLSFIRRLRRKGKNRLSSMNSRKRKLEKMLSLVDEVRQMRERKNRLLHERQLLFAERERVQSKFSQLCKHIFQSLRDSEGNAYSPFEWSLQQSSDGSIALVPWKNQLSLMVDHQPPPPSTSSTSDSPQQSATSVKSPSSPSSSEVLVRRGLLNNSSLNTAQGNHLSPFLRITNTALKLWKPRCVPTVLRQTANQTGSGLPRSPWLCSPARQCATVCLLRASGSFWNQPPDLTARPHIRGSLKVKAFPET